MGDRDSNSLAVEYELPTRTFWSLAERRMFASRVVSRIWDVPDDFIPSI
jgi:hypothetical protein